MGQQCVRTVSQYSQFSNRSSRLRTDPHVSLPSVISTPSHTAGGRTHWWVMMMPSVRCVGLMTGCTRRPGIPPSRSELSTLMKWRYSMMPNPRVRQLQCMYLFNGVCCCLMRGETWRWWCLLHRSGSAILIAHPVTRDPSFSYWLSWNMMLG